jgi:hypothetical protein
LRTHPSARTTRLPDVRANLSMAPFICAPYGPLVARRGRAERPFVRHSPDCEKRSAERPGGRAWEGTCGVSRTCPDKAPSCYSWPPTRRKLVTHRGVVFRRVARALGETARDTDRRPIW